jgi:hypothetical protein
LCDKAALSYLLETIEPLGFGESQISLTVTKGLLNEWNSLLVRLLEDCDDKLPLWRIVLKSLKSLHVGRHFLARQRMGESWRVLFSIEPDCVVSDLLNKIKRFQALDEK